jgi:hypothetical protein
MGNKKERMFLKWVVFEKTCVLFGATLYNVVKTGCIFFF